ncbi:MAG: hypothetical protein AAF675_04190 [Pseudomonadota bacterium]
MTTIDGVRRPHATQPPLHLLTILRQALTLSHRCLLPGLAIGVSAEVLIEISAVFAPDDPVPPTLSLEEAFSLLLDSLARIGILLIVASMHVAALTSLGLVAMRDETPRVMQALRQATSRIIPVAAVLLIVGAALLFGTVALIVPGIWLCGVFAVVMPVVMVDGTILGALRRSAALTKGYRWPIAFLMVILLVLFTILTQGAGLLAGALNDIAFGVGYPVAWLVSAWCALLAAQIAVALYLELLSLSWSADTA